MTLEKNSVYADTFQAQIEIEKVVGKPEPKLSQNHRIIETLENASTLSKRSAITLPSHPNDSHYGP